MLGHHRGHNCRNCRNNNCRGNNNNDNNNHHHHHNYNYDYDSVADVQCDLWSAV